MRTSIVIPTRNEEGNVPRLLRRVCAVIDATDEVLFIDDGSDDLPAVVARESTSYRQNVSAHRRAVPLGGLSGAVVEGIQRAQFDRIVVCDGDLQHPPEVIPALVSLSTEADVVVATRYRSGGDSGGLSSRFRRVASRGTGWGCKSLFPIKLRKCTDPMSGFFLLDRRRVDLTRLRPRGFKILLEILVRSPRLRVAEVPFDFASREEGASNASRAEAARFLRQVILLRVWTRATAYALVGLSGILPNLAVLSLGMHAGLHYVWAAVLAVQAAIVWNFVGAELFVWRDRKTMSPIKRFLLYALVGELDLLRIPFVILLVQTLGTSTAIATVLTIGASFVLRYVAADRSVYRVRPARVAAADSDAVLESVA